ncbi:LapA family protein [Allofustis seminis]|uniref:LapA family protein n=1 Tax=Allofustis seminis TaxID=166939 RepID=UPI00037A7D23|nr:lipopolysaccharide assembly protein LapA domain-containing protein [Allofustis seminis]
MKNQWQLVIALILSLLVAALAVLNVAPVPINLGFQIIELPLIILILGTLLVGVLVTALFSTFKIYKEHRKIQKLDQEIDHLKQKHAQELNKKLTEKDQEIENLSLKISSYEREIHNLKQSIPAYMMHEQKNNQAEKNNENI